MKSILNGLISIYNDNKNFYLFSVIIIILTSCFFWYHNALLNLHFTLYISSKGSVIKILVLSYLTYFLINMAMIKHPSPVRALIQVILSILKKPKTILSFFCLLMFINIPLSLYTSIKSTIGTIFPFSFDIDFYQLDLLLHFGQSPWELTHTLFASPYASSFINLLYNLWFFLVWGTLLVFMLKEKIHREKYLISFIGCWILLGGGLAILLSSAGPCYIQLLDPESTFYQELFLRLNEQNNILIENELPQLWALETQNTLWQAHINSELGIGSGISAMPSMHVSMSVLMALAVYSQHKKIGMLFWFYMVGILIGSVHLGWHYAVDGYISIITTILWWHLVNKIYDKYHF